MKNRSINFHLSFLFCLLAFGCANKSEACFVDVKSMPSNATRHAGKYPAPSDLCVAELKISALGGGLGLYVQLKGKTESIFVADDVNGVAWMSGTTLIFSVSPIYGKPGIYSLTDCNVAHINKIVAPKTINDAYPDGADYFELDGVISSSSNIYYYYSPDVDKTDFSEFRTAENICMVTLHK